MTLTAPNGGQTLVGNTIEITWTASDPDKDPLTFTIQYSPDNGQTWMVVAQNVTGNTFMADAKNIVASQQAIFRVWASDGLNTSSDDSDAINTVPNSAPVVSILAPTIDKTVAVSETVALQGEGYDDDTGPLQGTQLEWLSDLDGALGTGELLSLSKLSVGEHTITLRTPDGNNGFVTETVKVTVVADSKDVPVANAMVVSPPQIDLTPATQISMTQVSVDNQNAKQVIAWSVTTSATWLKVSKNSGNTPDSFTVQYSGMLASGRYETTLEFTSAAISGQKISVPVSVEVPAYQTYIPSTFR